VDDRMRSETHFAWSVSTIRIHRISQSFPIRF
jgi:hypothetical protein